ERVEVPGDAYTVEERGVSVSGEHVVPHVVEPSYGLDRIMYTVLEHCLVETEKGGERYRILKLPPWVAPYQAAVFPLMARDGMDEMAREIAGMLRKKGWRVFYDEGGSIGRRYARMDEVGTPCCITVDHTSLEKGDVTVRERDTGEQERVAIGDLDGYLKKRLEFL
ncbi:MAG: glycine--tRNA ligase, partial [Thermoplasmata archaeon]|nr:glycine--tRNA ligase [Thermoplasmata archaeon]